MHLILKVFLVSFLFLFALRIGNSTTTTAKTTTSTSTTTSNKPLQSDEYSNPSLISHLKMTFHDLLDILRGEVEPIDNRCLFYYRTLADASAQFVECVANYSRPFRVCQNCLNRYLDFKNIHMLIKNVNKTKKKRKKNTK